MICDFCQHKIEIAACPKCRAENVFICDLENEIKRYKDMAFTWQTAAMDLQKQISCLEQQNKKQKSLIEHYETNCVMLPKGKGEFESYEY